jgi:septum formation protein
MNTLGIPYRIHVESIDETPLSGEEPQQMVERLSLQKAQVVSARYADALVIGADTTVAIDGQILGKPEDRADAVRMVSLLQGRTHEVWSAFSLVSQARAIAVTVSRKSEVDFHPMSPSDVLAYVATGESDDKAGSYALQGICGQFIREIRGSFTHIIGLDVAALLVELRRLGVFSVGI